MCGSYGNGYTCLAGISILEVYFGSGNLEMDGEVPCDAPGATMEKPAERWKSCAPEGFSRYEISSLCRVRRVKDDKIMKLRVNCYGYGSYNLVDDTGTPGYPYAHILGMHIHTPNPSKKPSVDHKNRDKLDNDIDNNLLWATYTEQNMNRKVTPRKTRHVLQYTQDMILVAEWDSVTLAAKSTEGLTTVVIRKSILRQSICGGFRWKYPEIEVIPGEVWKIIPFPELQGKYLASSEGRIKRKDGKLYKGYVDEYVRVGFRINGTMRHYGIHRLAMAAFHGISDLEVNHKNGAKADNKLTNLEYVTSSQNAKHAHDTGLTTRTFKPVIQLDMDGKEIARYESFIAAGIAVHTVPSNISAVCTGRTKTAKGFKWKCVE